MHTALHAILSVCRYLVQLLVEGIFYIELINNFLLTNVTYIIVFVL